MSSRSAWTTQWDPVSTPTEEEGGGGGVSPSSSSVGEKEEELRIYMVQCEGMDALPSIIRNKERKDLKGPGI